MIFKSSASYYIDRPWPAPQAPWIMKMKWSELLFAHWSVDPSLIVQHLPPSLSLDTYEGKAWIGVVPFLMSKMAPRGFPAVPGLSRFAELNVRTYVIKDGKPGVWFFSLDAENPIAVRAARAAFSLPYMDANMILQNLGSPEQLQIESKRTHRGEAPGNFSAVYQAHGPTFHSKAGTLEDWLTSRYCLYSANKRGQLYRGEIAHAPWTLRAAHCKISENTLGESLNFDLSAEPHLLFAEPLLVRAWWATNCTRQTGLLSQ